MRELDFVKGLHTLPARNELSLTERSSFGFASYIKFDDKADRSKNYTLFITILNPLISRSCRVFTLL